MTEQPALFDLFMELPPPERGVCICCGALEAFVVAEAATFKDYPSRPDEPYVSVHWHCDACGDDSLTLRFQESPWIRRIWKLPPPPLRSWRRNSRKRSRR